MSISQNFPEEGPTLNLNFAGSRTLDPRITFTRTQTTSNGSTYMGRDGLIKYAGPNEPRFDHRYVNGEIESLGLLIEEQRTNLFPTSEVFVSGWGGGGTTNTDTILNPYGVLGTVYYITGNERYRTFNATGYSTLAFSFFTKKRFGGLERDYTYIEILQVAIGGGSLDAYYFRFNEDNLDTTYFKDVKREEYPNGWYRFSCRLIARPDYNGGTFATNSRVDIEGSASDNYVWGIQVEAASFATSYIPTSGSTKTRNPDNASITGSNFTEWYNQSEGTFYVSSRFFADGEVGQLIFQVDGNTNANRNAITFRNELGSNQIRASDVNFSASPTAVDLWTFSGSLANTEYKTAYAIKTDDYAAVTNFPNGQETIVTSAARVLQEKTTLRLGSGISGINPLNGHIAQLTYYPTRLTNTQLQTLTK